jgi:hypothetical protein
MLLNSDQEFISHECCSCEETIAMQLLAEKVVLMLSLFTKLYLSRFDLEIKVLL